MRSFQPVFALIIAVAIGALGGCVRPALQRFEYTRLCMGVRTQIVLYAEDEHAASEAAAAAFERIGQLDAVMSDYRRDSELNRLCDRAGSGPIRASEDVFDVLSQSLAVSRASDGAFDVSIGPLVQLWRQARADHALPPSTTIDDARRLVNFRNIVLIERDHTVTLLKPGMRLDLGGIGKGYAAQRAVDLFRARGVTACLVALAGDIAVGDPPPHERGWRIEVHQQSQAHSRWLILRNAAVSTSGDTEQFTEIHGVRYSHLIDPRTGLGVTSRIAVTVVASRGEIADGLSSAACVSGPEKIPSLIQSFHGSAAIVDQPHGDEFRQTIIDPSHRLQWADQGHQP
jgi:FAD:protein FMN transferase